MRTNRLMSCQPGRFEHPAAYVRRLHRSGAILIGAGCSACSAAPAQDVFGSFVPSWLLCALIGIAAAIVCRFVFGYAGLSDHLLLPPLTYIGIAVAATLAAWLVWFGH